MAKFAQNSRFLLGMIWTKMISIFANMECLKQKVKSKKAQNWFSLPSSFMKTNRFLLGAFFAVALIFACSTGGGGGGSFGGIGGTSNACLSEDKWMKVCWYVSDWPKEKNKACNKEPYDKWVESCPSEPDVICPMKREHNGVSYEIKFLLYGEASQRSCDWWEEFYFSDAGN